MDMVTGVWVREEEGETVLRKWDVKFAVAEDGVSFS